MLFLIIAIVVGWGAARIWPTLIAWSSGYAVVVTPIRMLIAQHNRAAFGESVDWSVANVGMSVAINAVTFLGVALISYCLKRLIKRDAR